LLGSRFTYTHFAGLTLALTYVLMLLGAYTSAISAGLPCPDWPTCYGMWVPFFHPTIVANAPYSAIRIFAEWTHRELVMIVRVFII
jgi:heme A synthase